MTLRKIAGVSSIGFVVAMIACIPFKAVAAAFIGDDLVQLIQTLKSDDDLACEIALAEVAKLGPSARTAVHPVCQHLSSHNQLVRSLASDALVAIGPDSVQPLKQLLTATAPIVRAAALQTLGRLKAISVESLSRFVEDPDPRVRAAVAIAIQHGDDDNIAEVLVRLLRDEEPAVLVQTCLIFKQRQIAPEVTVPALIAALSKESTSAVAMEALSRFGMDAQSAIPELIAQAQKIDLQNGYFKPPFETLIARIGPPSRDDSLVLCSWISIEDPDKTELIANALGRMESADESISERLDQVTLELLEQGRMVQRKYANADWETKEEFDNSTSYIVAAESCAVAYWHVTRNANRFIDLIERIIQVSENSIYFPTSSPFYGTSGRFSPWCTFSESDAVLISRMLNSKNKHIVNTAFFAMGDLGSKGNVHADLLIELLKTHVSDPDWVTPALALKDIGASVAEKALPALVQSFKEGRTSLEELAKFVDKVQFVTEASETILKDGLRSSDPLSAQKCARVLCRISRDPEDTAALVLQAVKSRRISTFSAIESFQRMSELPASAQEFLMSVLSKGATQLRGKAAAAIGKAGAKAITATPNIAPLLDSPRFTTRLQAATALFLITDDHESFNSFLKAEFANESNRTVELMNAVESITSLGSRGERFHHHVLENLDLLIEYDVVRLCEALKSSHSDSSNRILERIAKSRNWVAWTEATSVLESIKNSQPKEIRQ